MILNFTKGFDTDNGIHVLIKKELNKDTGLFESHKVSYYSSSRTALSVQNIDCTFEEHTDHVLESS